LLGSEETILKAPCLGATARFSYYYETVPKGRDPVSGVILHVKHLIAEKTKACTAHPVAYNKIKLNPVYKYIALLILLAIFSPDAERK